MKIGETDLRVQLLPLALRTSADCHKARISPGPLNIKYNKLKAMIMLSQIDIVRWHIGDTQELD